MEAIAFTVDEKADAVNKFPEEIALINAKIPLDTNSKKSILAKNSWNGVL